MMIDRRWPAPLVALALALTVAGCAGDLPAITAPQPAPPNYARLTSGHFATALSKLSIAGASISAIQPAVAPQPAEWFACVKLASGEYYAVFFADGKLVDARSALSIDRCGVAAGYAPLPPPEKPKPAKPTKSKEGEKR